MSYKKLLTVGVTLRLGRRVTYVWTLFCTIKFLTKDMCYFHSKWMGLMHTPSDKKTNCRGIFPADFFCPYHT